MKKYLIFILSQFLLLGHAYSENSCDSVIAPFSENAADEKYLYSSGEPCPQCETISATEDRITERIVDSIRLGDEVSIIPEGTIIYGQPTARHEVIELTSLVHRGLALLSDGYWYPTENLVNLEEEIEGYEKDEIVIATKRYGDKLYRPAVYRIVGTANIRNHQTAVYEGLIKLSDGGWYHPSMIFKTVESTYPSLVLPKFRKDPKPTEQKFVVGQEVLAVSSNVSLQSYYRENKTALDTISILTSEQAGACIEGKGLYWLDSLIITVEKLDGFSVGDDVTIRAQSDDRQYNIDRIHSDGNIHLENYGWLTSADIEACTGLFCNW